MFSFSNNRFIHFQYRRNVDISFFFLDFTKIFPAFFNKSNFEKLLFGRLTSSTSFSLEIEFLKSILANEKLETDF